ncbi:GNAT family N-acetyltransferase [Pseudonocardiaceae bacterium YIM PH 21723]|nr:GNAT family N-acetyltransferase [Pseudonocardiaceae bacterium YIM PH 21723]
MAEVVLRLTVRALTALDLPLCTWAGSEHHLRQVAHQLDRARLGEVDYLALCPPSGQPVAIGGVDYQASDRAGTLWQLAVHPALQSCGIGSHLIEAAEQHILARGLRRAELRVEQSNIRARILYERLGYVRYAEVLDEQEERPTTYTVMRKSLR